MARWPSARAFAVPLAAAIFAMGYVFSLLPYLGVDNYHGYKWIMAALCYGALAAGMLDLWGTTRTPLGPRLSKPSSY